MEKYNFTYNGNTTTFKVESEKGVESMKWDIDSHFWTRAISDQIENLGIATNYLSNVHGKPAAEILHELFNQQVKYGGFTPETLDELADQIIARITPNTTEEEFIEANELARASS